MEKPANVSVAEAASIGTPFTAASIALKRAGAQKGETVMVMGVVGSTRKLRGCKVIAWLAWMLQMLTPSMTLG